MAAARALAILACAVAAGCTTPSHEEPPARRESGASDAVARAERDLERLRSADAGARDGLPARDDDTAGSTDPSAGSDVAPARSDAAGPDASHAPRVLATVGERVVDANDLADAALYFFRESYYESLAYLIGREIARAEAARLGVRVERDEVERAVERELDQQRNELRVQFGGEITLEQFAEDNFGEDPESYRERVHAIVRDKMLRDRVIRYSLVRDGSIDVRELAVEERALADEIRAAAIEGAEFATLVEKHSVLATRRDGGRIARVRAGFFPPPIDAAVSKLEVGEVSPVLEVERDGRSLYHLYRVIRRVPGDRVPFGAVRDSILAELDDSPVTSLEVLQWNRSRERLYPVRRGRP